MTIALYVLAGGLGMLLALASGALEPLHRPLSTTAYTAALACAALMGLALLVALLRDLR